MILRILGFSLFSFVLGIVLVAAISPASSSIEKDAATTIQDDRAADREAIRAHIDSIFQAFIRKDTAALRATHAQNWLGYLEGSRKMIKGVDGYMDWNQVDPKSPYGMKSYKMREFDMIFKGDAAFVCFVADVESITRTVHTIARCASPISIRNRTASGFRTAATPLCIRNRWKNNWRRPGQ